MYKLHNFSSGLLTPAINMTAAASGSNGITVADDDDIDFGTGDFFVSITLGRSAGWQPSGLTRLVFKSDGTNGYSMNIAGSGSGSFLTFGINGTTYTSSIAPFTVVQANQMVTFSASIVRSSASVAGSVTFYKDGQPFGTAQAITAGAPVTVSNAVPLYVLGTSTTRTSGNVTTYISGNFAPTAAEMLQMYETGIPASMQWGSNTNLVTNGDFETWTTATNPATWVEGSAVSASVAQVSGGSQYAGTYSLQFTGAGDPSSTVNNCIQQAEFSTSDTGREVRFMIAARVTSGSGRLYWGQGSTAFKTIAAASLSGSWQVFILDTVIGDTSTAQLRQLTLAGDAGVVYQVDAYSVQFLGPTVALLPNSIPTSSATTWDDATTNANNATLPAAGATKVTIRK